METKRILALAALATLAGNATFAAKITKDEAKTIASKFFSNNGTALKKAASADAALTLAGYSSGYYAFNRGTSSGYVIVAADDRAASQVLGYADEGTIDMDNLPANLAWWLSEYDRQLAGATASQAAMKATADSSRAEIAPMVTSMWDQDSPYSDLCPTVGQTVCPTGCVATAMAQIMYFHKWPLQGSGSNSYSCNGKVISVDFSQSIYDWASMTDRYNSKSTDESKAAVARLMYDAGVSVNMAYSTQSSGSSTEYVPEALIEHFGYDKATRCLYRDYYNYADWSGIIYDELAASRPVYYSGVNTSASVGHAFVCDGYRDGYFHFNWGWSGMSNGYFMLYALSPSQQGTGGSSGGYNSGQQIIVGVQKKLDNSTTVPLFYNDSPFKTNTSTASFSQSVVFTGRFLNYGSYTSSVALGLMAISAAGDTTWLAGSNGSYQSGYGTSRMSISMAQFPKTEGKYDVYPAYRDVATGKWYKMHTYTSYQSHMAATVSGSTIDFSTPVVEASKLSADDFAATSVMYAYKKFTAKASVTNTGGDYAGSLKVVFAKPGSTQIVQITASKNVSIDKDMTMLLDLSGTTPADAGTYEMWLIDDDENQVSQKDTVTVAEAPTGAMALTLTNKLAIARPTAVSADNIDISANIRCTSGFYADQVVLAFFRNNETSTTTMLYQDVIAGAGDNVTVNFKGELPTAEVGDRYTACVYYVKNSGWQTLPAIGSNYNRVTFTIGSLTGIDTVGGTTVSSDLLIYNASGVLVARQKGATADLTTFPKGLYIVKQGNRTVKMCN